MITLVTFTLSPYSSAFAVIQFISILTTNIFVIWKYNIEVNKFWFGGNGLKILVKISNVSRHETNIFETCTCNMCNIYVYVLDIWRLIIPNERQKTKAKINCTKQVFIYRIIVWQFKCHPRFSQKVWYYHLKYILSTSKS